MGRDSVLPYVFLDDDKIGRSAMEELKGGLYATSADKLISVREYTKFDGSEVEDLIPPELVIDVVDREIRLEQDFSEYWKEGSPIVDQIERWAAEQGHVLTKGWKVPLAVAVKKRLLAEDAKELDSDFVQTWKILFERFLK
jgi:hypothetical protein